jgi:hypothetical protein
MRNKGAEIAAGTAALLRQMAERPEASDAAQSRHGLIFLSPHAAV